MAKVQVDQKISFGHEVVQCKIQINNDVLGIKYIESTNANQFKGYEEKNKYPCQRWISDDLQWCDDAINIYML